MRLRDEFQTKTLNDPTPTPVILSYLMEKVLNVYSQIHHREQYFICFALRSVMLELQTNFQTSAQNDPKMTQQTFRDHEDPLCTSKAQTSLHSLIRSFCFEKLRQILLEVHQTAANNNELTLTCSRSKVEYAFRMIPLCLI